MSLQFRPRGSHEPLYSPDRDMGHFFLDVYDHLVLAAFEKNAMPPWLSDVAKSGGTTESRLQDAARKLREGLELFRDPNMGSANQALAESKFWDCSDSSRACVLALVGLVMVSKYFPSVREAYGFPDIAIPKMMIATPMIQEAIGAGLEALGVDEAVRRGKGV